MEIYLRLISGIKRSLWATLAVLSLAYPQENQLHFDHLTTEDGLSDNNVNYIYQDSRGFMWFGANDGLNRYDGYQFITYHHDPLDTNSLPDNRVQVVLEDRHGNLWIGTKDGLAKMNSPDGNDKTFITYKKITGQPASLSHNDIRSIIEDREGKLWIGTKGGGICKLAISANMLPTSIAEDITAANDSPIITVFRNDPKDGLSLADDNIEHICEDTDGDLWFATDNGLSRLEPDNRHRGQFTNYQFPEGVLEPCRMDIEVLFQDDAGDIWIGARCGLIRFNKVKGVFKRYFVDQANHRDLSNHIWAIAQAPLGRLWIGAVNGFSNFDPQTGRFTRYLHNHLVSASISYDVIKHIYRDRTGVLWVATAGGGINKLNSRSTLFRHYLNDGSSNTGVGGHHIRSIYEDKHRQLWIGTIDGGLYKGRMTDPMSQEITFEHLVHQESNPNSISNNGILSIFEDRMENLWIGTWGGGLSRLRGKEGNTHKFIHYQHNPDDPTSLRDPQNEVWTIYQDHQDKLWLGTENGLNLAIFPSGNLASAKVTFKLMGDEANPDHPVNKRILSIYEDSQSKGKRLWVGTTGGLILINFQASGKKNFRQFKHDPNNPHSISQNDIICLWEDKTSATLWIGTYGGGLNKLNLKEVDSRTEPQFIRFTTHQGLPNDIIYGILGDETGNLWISTNKGLSKFNHVNNTFHNFDVNDGLQHNLFSLNASHKLHSGEMVFGGVNGINIFDPLKIKDNPNPPPVVILAFKEFDKVIRRDIASPQTLNLSYDDNFFSFEFSALDFTNPGKNLYKFKLEGFDQDWHTRSANSRYANYTNLDGGDYLFKVKAANSDGVWNEEGLSVKVVITPPVWKRSWFRLAVFSGLVFIVFGWYVMRLRNIKRQKFMLEVEVNERTAELRQNQRELETKTEALSDVNRQLKIEVDERRRAEKTAHAANQAKSRFLANMSHELRTPLNGILGYAQILEYEKDLSKSQHKSVEIIKRSGKHLLMLINDVLDFSKIEAEKIELHKSEFPFLPFLEGIIGIFHLKANQSEIALYSDFDRQLPAIVIGDERRLRQALINLIGNALKFTPVISPLTGDPGEVHFKVFPINNKIRFEVKDNGIGIAKNQFKHVFQQFRQVGDLRNKVEGTGLGLAISRKLVKLMGGELKVESELGIGSLFWMEIDLPELTGPSTAKLTPEQKIIGIKGKQKSDSDFPKILIAEPNEEERSCLTKLLQPLKFDLLAAKTVVECLDMIAQFKPDLILIDPDISQLNSFDLLKSIRSQADTKNMVIVALSANVFIDDRRKRMAAGFDDFIPKPIQTEDLHHKIAHNLQLEWIYEKKSANPQESFGKRRSPKINLAPPKKDIQKLQKLAKIGDVEAIVEYVDKIVALDNKYLHFATELRKNAKEFQLLKIKSLLKIYLENDE